MPRLPAKRSPRARSRAALEVILSQRLTAGRGGPVGIEQQITSVRRHDRVLVEPVAGKAGHLRGRPASIAAVRDHDGLMRATASIEEHGIAIRRKSQRVVAVGVNDAAQSDGNRARRDGRLRGGGCSDQKERARGRPNDVHTASPLPGHDGTAHGKARRHSAPRLFDERLSRRDERKAARDERQLPPPSPWRGC